MERNLAPSRRAAASTVAAIDAAWDAAARRIGLPEPVASIPAPRANTTDAKWERAAARLGLARPAGSTPASTAGTGSDKWDRAAALGGLSPSLRRDHAPKPSITFSAGQGSRLRRVRRQ